MSCAGSLLTEFNRHQLTQLLMGEAEFSSSIHSVMRSLGQAPVFAHARCFNEVCRWVELLPEPLTTLLRLESLRLLPRLGADEGSAGYLLRLNLRER